MIMVIVLSSQQANVRVHLEGFMNGESWLSLRVCSLQTVKLSQLSRAAHLSIGCCHPHPQLPLIYGRPM